ncbi:hypothetical protein M0805_003509, partial [Coniferiporia weirii]
MPVRLPDDFIPTFFDPFDRETTAVKEAEATRNAGALIAESSSPTTASIPEEAFADIWRRLAELKDESVALKNEIAALKSESAAPEDKSVAPKDESVAPKDESVAPKDETAAPKNESAAPKNESTALKDENTAPKLCLSEVEDRLTTTMKAVLGDRAAINKVRLMVLLDEGRNELANICAGKSWQEYRDSFTNRDELYQHALLHLQTAEVTDQWRALVEMEKPCDALRTLV